MVVAKVMLLQHLCQEGITFSCWSNCVLTCYRGRIQNYLEQREIFERHFPLRSNI